MKKLKLFLMILTMLAAVGLIVLRFTHTAPTVAQPDPVAETPEPTLTPEPEPTPTATPEPTPEPTPTPTPEPTPDLRELPESWFDDAVFLGDSVTVALEKYCDQTEALGDALFLCEFSYSVRNAISGEVDIWYKGKPWRVENVIPETGATKVFAMLGTNDIALPGGIERTIELWGEMIARIRENSPDVTFYIESCLPMYYGGQLYDLNNAKLDEYNVQLRAFCEENGHIYVDIAGYFKDANNSLIATYSEDQYVHVTPAAAELWAELLKDPANYSINPRSFDNELD